MGVRKSVGEGTYKDVAPEDVEFTKARSKEKDKYENKRKEIADRARAKQNIKLVEDYGQQAIREWNVLKSNNGVDFRDISKEDMMEWISIVEEREVGSISETQLKTEQREIELRLSLIHI